MDSDADGVVREGVSKAFRYFIPVLTGLPVSTDVCHCSRSVARRSQRSMTGYQVCDGESLTSSRGVNRQWNEQKRWRMSSK